MLTNRKIISQNTVVSLIKNHHKIIKETIFSLKDELNSPSQKRKNFTKFLEEFKMHTKSEEETLYERLLDFQELKIETLKLFEENRLAELLAQDLESLRYEEVWSEQMEAKLHVLYDLFFHHIKHEEKVIFPKIELYLSQAELEDLGREYLARCSEHIEFNLQEHQGKQVSQALL